jgi:hypothetical protein
MQVLITARPPPRAGCNVQHFTLNVGCAFFRPTEKAIELLRRVAYSLSQASGWDQQVMIASPLASLVTIDLLMVLCIGADCD